ncbi:MAG: HAD family hydrolase [Oscillospiraceae bacterium]|nr:HAD family hydrolase [Oscillospiraceae bacterium]
MEKYILFDLDGTVTDPETGITLSVAYALKHFGIEVEDVRSLRKFIGPPLHDSFIEFYGFSREKAFEAVEKYRERFAETGIFENEPYAGMHELLADLKDAGYTLAIASSKPEVFTKRIIEHFGFSPYFTHVCGSELNGDRTNKAEVITYALGKLGSPAPKNVVMIGDRHHDIVGAKNNGLTSVGVLYGFGDEAELRDAGADYIAASVSEIASIIANIFN